MMNCLYMCVWFVDARARLTHVRTFAALHALVQTRCGQPCYIARYCVYVNSVSPNLKRYDWSGFGGKQTSRKHNIKQCSAAGRRGRTASAQARVARRKDGRV